VHLLLSIFLRVLEIVSAVHSCGVVHFDIKGDNLLLQLPKPGAQSAQAGCATPRTPATAFARTFFAPGAAGLAAGASGSGLYCTSSPATAKAAQVEGMGWQGFASSIAPATAASGKAEVSTPMFGTALSGNNTCAGSGASTARLPEPPLQVVLADFGDAVMFGSSGESSTHRHRGTELFSSPEMLLLGRHKPDADSFDRRKHKGAGAAHDVWSCGCTLYELLTGEVLFQEEVS
jgi:serine/threonine protein kinase